jgi:glucuronokinase
VPSASSTPICVCPHVPMGRMISSHAFARVGLLGAPSDGYFGRALSVSIRNFKATVCLRASRHVEIKPGRFDRAIFSSIDDFYDTTRWRGYYGGTRIIQATIMSLLKYCREAELPLDAPTFAIEYESSIPLRLGLAGSSAIATATLRALMTHFRIDLPLPVQAQIIHNAESRELWIPAGPQDRVVQAYEGLIYMDFNRELMLSRGFGQYERLDVRLLPRLFLAYAPSLSEGTEIIHVPLRERWERGDSAVIAAMNELASIAEKGCEALVSQDHPRFAELVNESYEVRSRVHHVGAMNARLALIARETCGSANLAGSGGAVVGTFSTDDSLDELRRRLGPLGAQVVECLV